MGIDYLGMRDAIQICKQATTTLDPGSCPGATYADEMPAHIVKLDAFWIDRTEVTNQQFEPSRANYCDASCAAGVIDPSYDDGYPETAPVGSFPAGVSWCGALDMAGNVREWVADWFGYYSADPQVNPVGPSEGESYIPKGGCWLDTADNLRGSNRGQNTPDYTRHNVGFRCVVELD